MKQVRVNNYLYVMDTEAYTIKDDTDASIIFVPEDSFDAYAAVNSGLTLTKYNYNVIRVTKPEYDIEPTPDPPTPTQETRLVVTYNVESTAQPTQLYLLGDPMGQPVSGSVDFSAIEIDGEDVAVSTIDGAYGTYTFASTGEHTVKYTLDNGAISDYRFCYPQLEMNMIVPMKSVYIPSGVTFIGEDAFNNIWGTLDYIVVDDDNETYTSNGESGNCIVEKSTNTLIFISNNLVIPNDVTTIADYVGSYDSNIRELVIPNSVTTIGDSVFVNSALSALTIGSGVTEIGEEAFTECESLDVMTIYGTNDLSYEFPSGVFSTISTLYVDSSMISTYESMRDDYGLEFEITAITQ